MSLAAAQYYIERALCTLTGPELMQKYLDGDAGRAWRAVMKCEVDTYSTHNPLWYYAKAVWFDNAAGKALLYPPVHKDKVADPLLALALGEYDKFDGLHIEAARRAMKSTFATAFVDWYFKREKEVNGLDAVVMYWRHDETEARARSWLVKLKNQRHEYNKRYWPDYQVPRSEGTRSQYNFPKREAGSSIAESQMNGLSFKKGKAGKGAHLHVFDDIVDEKHRNSVTLRKEVDDGIDQARELKAPPYTRFVHICTPYNKDDAVIKERNAKREDGTPAYKIFILPAADGDIDDPKTEILFPTIPALSLDSLKRDRNNEMERRGNDRFFQLQKMLNIAATGTNAFEWNWFRKVELTDYYSTRKSFAGFRYIAIDSAWKGAAEQARKGCWTAIGVIDIIRRNQRVEIYLLDLLASNEITSDDGAKQVCRLMGKWGTKYVFPEQRSEKTFEGTLRLAAEPQGLQPVIIAPEAGMGQKRTLSDKTKDDRISALAGRARSGEVFYLESCPYIEHLEDEVTDYPDVAHRDILDMMASACSEVVMRQWAPMLIDPIGDRLIESLDEEQYKRMALSMRSTGLPMFPV